MDRRAQVSTSNSEQMSTAHSLTLLSEYTHTLDSLPLDLSRNFADLRELDAVLSSSMTSITQKMRILTQMIEENSPDNPKEERLWLLTEIAEEATRLKLGGEDKIRVACQAADSLKLHTNHLRALLEQEPLASGLDTASVIMSRNTAYPHVAARSFMPATLLESGRRRRGGVTSLLVSAPEPSPAKRRRVRDDDVDHGRSPRKDRNGDRHRNGNRAKKVERAASPAESLLSITSHMPAQNQNNGRAANNQVNASRAGNGTAANKRARPSANANRNNTPQPNIYDPTNANGKVFNVPPSSAHPSLPLPYGNTVNTYDQGRTTGGVLPDWNASGAARYPHQLEGPGMPVQPLVSNTAPPPNQTDAGEDGEPDGEAVEGEGDDTKTYCVCNRVSYGEMIACDAQHCEREWFHLACTGLSVPPEGRWYCEDCSAKRARRASRGGKRRTTANGGTAAAAASGGGGGGGRAARSAAH